MTLGRMIRKVRLSLLRFPAVGYGQLPEMPVYVLRDLWRGDSIHGMHLAKGEFIYQDCVIPLYPGKWGGDETSLELMEHIHDFSWLRDLRELGTENARLAARELVLDWISNPPSRYDVAIYQPFVLATRVANWLGHYDFFAASADSRFHYQFMKRILTEGRYISVMLPMNSGTHEVFTFLKAAMAVTLCMPEQFDLISRISKYLQTELAGQVLEDGVHIERDPEIQVFVLRDLVEIRLMYQLINVRPPSELVMILDTMSRALRALRHGDGRLALFNGGSESNADFIESILSHSTQKKVAMTDMKKGGYIRCYANRSTLLIDSGIPPRKGTMVKHAGSLSFEFSFGKQRIIVNCGNGGSSVWQSALAGTAAHSVLKLNNLDSVLIQDNQLADMGFNVEALHETNEGAHWVEVSHNGWRKSCNALYLRKFYLSADGQDLRGEEIIDSDQSFPFEIRFHLHPAIKVSETTVSIAEEKKEKAFILSFSHNQEGKQEWLFRFSGAEGRIEESVYFGQKMRLATRQIVLYSSFQKEENGFKKQHVASGLESVKAKQTIQKEDSAYVAIFHNQDNHAEIRQENVSDPVSDGMSENLSKQDETVSESSEIEEQGRESHSVSDQKEEQDGFESPPSPQQTIVRWALRRKL